MANPTPTPGPARTAAHAGTARRDAGDDVEAGGSHGPPEAGCPSPRAARAPDPPPRAHRTHAPRGWTPWTWRQRDGRGSSAGCGARATWTRQLRGSGRTTDPRPDSSDRKTPSRPHLDPRPGGLPRRVDAPRRDPGRHAPAERRTLTPKQNALVVLGAGLLGAAVLRRESARSRRPTPKSPTSSSTRTTRRPSSTTCRGTTPTARSD